MALPNLDQFRITPSEAEEIGREFQLIASNVKLHAVDADVRKAIPRESGCYFWTLRIAGQQYGIYVGRTRSMRKRLSDYANEIQVHAPNDYKLRFFQEFICEADPGAAFDLYFMPVSEEEFKRREGDLVTRFKPLINSLRRPTAHDRERILQSFRVYYQDAFADQCSDA